MKKWLAISLLFLFLFGCGNIQGYKVEPGLIVVYSRNDCGQIKTRQLKGWVVVEIRSWAEDWTVYETTEFEDAVKFKEKANRELEAWQNFE